MQKIVLLAFVLVLLSMLLPGAGFVVRVSSSTTLHVYPGKTIQEAINLAQPRDTIIVHAGTYYENVIVNKTVSLIGENKHTTIIDGGAAQFDVVYISAHSVTINSFTLQRGGRGIYPDRRGVYVYSSNNTNISNNVIRDNVEGIFICISNDNVVRNNSIHANTKNGLWLYGSSNNVITYNTIANNGEFGMVLQGSCSNNLIFHNNFINDKNHHIATTGESGNVWDDGYPSGGNYWSDCDSTDIYSGQCQNETGSDGIGDTSYDIDVNNQDNYPLMGMFYDFRFWDVNIVISNSTIHQFSAGYHMNSTTGTWEKCVMFHVLGTEGTVGFCRVMIPRDFMESPYTVLVYNEKGNATELSASNSTHAFLYFTYTHSGIVIIIPEFPTLTAMLLILIVLTVTIAIHKRCMHGTHISFRPLFSRYFSGEGKDYV
jgi:parallel beta-helix repeat protein